MKKILLLEDDLNLGKSLTYNIQTLGFEVTWVLKLEEASEKISTDSFDLFIFDIMMGNEYSIDLCKELRKKKNFTPLIFISAIAHEKGVVEALNAGANDYIRKPFGIAEFLARVSIQLNTASVKRIKSELIEYKGLSIDINERMATFEGKPLNMNQIKLDILYYLTMNRNSVISRDNLLNYIQRENDVYDRTIDAHISQMRKSFKNLNIETIKITSIYGAGYKIEFL